MFTIKENHPVVISGMQEMYSTSCLALGLQVCDESAIVLLVAS